MFEVVITSCGCLSAAPQQAKQHNITMAGAFVSYEGQKKLVSYEGQKITS